jgi:hypothetical protein
MVSLIKKPKEPDAFQFEAWDEEKCFHPQPALSLKGEGLFLKAAIFPDVETVKVF